MGQCTIQRLITMAEQDITADIIINYTHDRWNLPWVSRQPQPRSGIFPYAAVCITLYWAVSLFDRQYKQTFIDRHTKNTLTGGRRESCPHWTCTIISLCDWLPSEVSLSRNCFIANRTPPFLYKKFPIQEIFYSNTDIFPLVPLLQHHKMLLRFQSHTGTGSHSVSAV